MTKVWRYALAALFLAAILLAAGIGWLFWTPGGAGFLLSALSRSSSLQIAAKTVNGRLADEIVLREVLVHWPRGEAKVEKMSLRWHPAALLHGEVAIEMLHLTDVEAQIAAAEEQVAARSDIDFTFPEIGPVARWLQVTVDHVQVDDFILHPEQGEEIHGELLQAGVSWSEGLLRIDKVSFTGSPGRLSGDVRIDFVGPALGLDLLAQPKSPPAGMEKVSLRAQLTPDAGRRHLSGSLQIAAADEKERLRLTANLDWRPERLALSDVLLTRPDGEAAIAGEAALKAAANWPFSFSLQLKKIDLFAETGTRTNLNGTVRAEGTVASYRGELQLANRMPGWQGGQLASEFSGDLQEIVFPELQGEFLRGQLTGRLSAGWQDGWRLQTALVGTALQPDALAADWPGKVNFDLEVTARGGQPTPMTASVKGQLRDSVLRGQKLTGAVAVQLQGEDLHVEQLALHGDGFDIAASGRLQDRIDFRAEISRLAGLLPGAAGSLQGKGWVRWQNDHLSGSLAARGASLALREMRVKSLSLQAEHAGKDAPLSLQAELQGVVWGEYRLASANLAARGSIAEHRLQLNAAGPDVQLALSATGGYAEEWWQGRLLTLKTGGRLLGSWTLAEPVSLQLTADRIKTARLRLNGPGGEFFAGRADLSLSPLLGSVEGDWQQLNLARGNPWLPDIQLSGSSSGSARLQWLPQRRLDLQGQLDAEGAIVRTDQRLPVRKISTEFAWGAEGLQATFAADLAAVGTLSGQLKSSQEAALHFPERGNFTANWQLDELARLSPWLPEMQLAGKSTGEVAGSWQPQHLQLDGQAQMAGKVTREGMTLDIRQFETTFAWGAEGLQARWTLDLADKGHFAGEATSAEPARLAMPESGKLHAAWQGLDLALLRPWLPDGMQLAGKSSGEVTGSLLEERRLQVEGQVMMAGEVVQDAMQLAVRRLQANFSWGEKGLRAGWQLDLAGQGGFTGEVTSPAPARLAMPEQGELRAEWRDIDISLLRPWLPEDLLLQGSLRGQLNGGWLPGQRLQLTGNAEVKKGELQWEQIEGVVTAALQQARIDWSWRDESLQGNLLLILENYGKAEGEFRLPLPARWPTRIDDTGPVQARLQGELLEEGLVNALLPGMVQESHGKVAVDLRVDGTWAKPELGGEMHLSDAAAYLPTAGIRVEDIRLDAQLSGQQVRITSFQVRSGPGRLEGKGTVSLDRWRLAGYQLEISGKEFRLIHLPELQLQVSPDLQVSGTTEKLTVRGEVRIPSLLISGRGAKAPIPPSSDLVIVDAPAKEKKELPLDLDVRVRIVLGEHVLVQTEGVDARLEGGLQLAVTGLDAKEMTAQGEIKVVQGKYSTYGVSLDITRGNILFAGGPVDRPTLDILATRTVGEVKAGVKVTGTPRTPKAELYSDPAMPDTDVLAYIVLGRPIGQGGGGDAGLMMLAANTLLSKGESAVLQDRLRRTFGLDVLAIEAGNGDVQGSQITIGKYLNPDLYISFGQSLFANTNEVRMRYNLSKRWQLESSMGEQSAVDLYYKIEFK